MKPFFSAAIMLFISWIGGHAGDLTIKIMNIRDSSGVLLVCFYRDSAEFEGDTPFRMERMDKQSMRNGEVMVNLYLEEGIYGIVVHDDENGSGIMEYNIAGIPKEGFGFSGYYLSGLKKPHFSDFSFDLFMQETVEVKMRYVL